MKTSSLKSRDGAPLDKVTIDAFRRGFCGQVLLPGDTGYDSARRIWNASIDKHPGLIARCSEAADVVRAVKFSRANNLLVADKSGGHNGNACLEWLPIAFPFAEGPRVRIRLPPAASPVRTQLCPTLLEAGKIVA